MANKRPRIKHKAKLKPKPAPQPTKEVADYHYEVKFSLEGFRIEDESGALARNLALTIEKVIPMYLNAMPVKRKVVSFEIKDLLDE